MGDVLEEDLSTEREMELESIAFSTHPPFVSSDLTTLTTSHFTRIFSKQYPSQLEDKSDSLISLAINNLKNHRCTNRGRDLRYNDWSAVTVPEIDLNRRLRRIGATGNHGNNERVRREHG